MESKSKIAFHFYCAPSDIAEIIYHSLEVFLLSLFSVGSSKYVELLERFRTCYLCADGVQVACVKVDSSSQEVDSYRLLNLKQFLAVFRSLQTQTAALREDQVG